MSHHTILSIHSSLDALCDAAQPHRRARLVANTRALIAGLSALLPPLSPAWLPRELLASHSSALAPSPIVPLLTPHARTLAEHLRAQGFLVRSICYPTVPRGEERVRICVHADNQAHDVWGLVQAVERWKEGMRERAGEVAPRL